MRRWATGRLSKKKTICRGDIIHLRLSVSLSQEPVIDVEYRALTGLGASGNPALIYVCSERNETTTKISHLARHLVDNRVGLVCIRRIRDLNRT